MKDCQNMDHYSKLKHDYIDLYSIFYEYFSYIFQSLVVENDGYTCMLPRYTPGPYFIKVKIILSLKFKINLIFYLIKDFMKHSCLNFFMK